jgi:lipoprotein NlpI
VSQEYQPTGIVNCGARSVNSTSTYLQAMLQKGALLHQNGQLDQAQSIYEQVLKVQPRHARALHLLGMLFGQSSDFKRALNLLNRAISLDPNNAAAHIDRGKTLKELGRYDAALASYNKAIALRPDYALAYCNRGTVYRAQFNDQAALDSYDQAIALQPDYAEAHYNRGVVLEERRQWDAALASYNHAIAVKPDHAQAHCNRGNVLRELNLLDAALASYEHALAIRADDAAACSNRGNLLRELQQVQAAVASCTQAIKIDPNSVEGHLNRSLALLLSGDYENGWVEYEWRWKVKHLASSKARPQLTQPLWLGEESIAGKTILLHAEQGLGDTLQFCRYVKLVADQGARVILEVPKPLETLLADVAGVTMVVGMGDAKPHYDFHAPLLSLPLAFKTTLSTVPAHMPYLRSNAQKVHSWKQQLGRRTRPRVGLVWSGGFRADQPELWAVNNRRNIPLASLAPLGDADVEFYSLQKGQPAESELSQLTCGRWNGPHVINHTTLLHDFADTAALIENLDLVISVDTSTAHLAGALGKPVWILNRFDTCWRWLLHRTDSPWYPTVRLYRQERVGNWHGVVERVRTDLMQFATRG